MTVFEAIKDMRAKSKRGETFSFTFASFSITRRSSEGNITVHRAILRKRTSAKYNQYAEYMEEYLNVDTNEPRKFWHCCLLTYNGQPLTIN